MKTIVCIKFGKIIVEQISKIHIFCMSTYNLEMNVTWLFNVCFHFYYTPAKNNEYNIIMIVFIIKSKYLRTMCLCCIN